MLQQVLVWLFLLLKVVTFICRASFDYLLIFRHLFINKFDKEVSIFDKNCQEIGKGVENCQNLSKK